MQELGGSFFSSVGSPGFQIGKKKKKTTSNGWEIWKLLVKIDKKQTVLYL